MAIILGAESASGLWFLLDVWTRHGWLRGLMARSPAAVASALVFVGLLFYHRPRPLPAWAMPDDGTVLYGLGLAVFCGVGVVILTIIRAAGG